jgi:hypothetical protein
MKKTPAVAVIGAIGTFGLIQVRAVSVNPPAWLRILIAATLAVILAVALWRSRRRPTLPPAIERLARNRPPRRPYEVVDKQLHITTPPGRSRRRDALIRWKLTLRNRSPERLGAIEFQVIGDVEVSVSDLIVRGRIGGHTALLPAEVDDRDGRAPVVKLMLPAPGLASNATMTVELEYVWPALAHVNDNQWCIDLATSVDLSLVSLTLDVPADDTQVAYALVYRSRLGVLSEHASGHVSPQPAADRMRFEFKYTKRRGDQFVMLRTRPGTPTPAAGGDAAVPTGEAGR